MDHLVEVQILQHDDQGWHNEFGLILFELFPSIEMIAQVPVSYKLGRQIQVIVILEGKIYVGDEPNVSLLTDV